MATKARYKGKGEYFGGIPARNLTDEEYDALTTEQKKTVRESDIYDVRSDTESRAAEPKSEAKQDDGERARS